MPQPPYVLRAAAVGALALGASNPFRSPFKQAPVVQVSTRDANANARWSGTLVSPASLAWTSTAGQPAR
jgi:formylglycine-generating enzyme required for sulfatase activity